MKKLTNKTSRSTKKAGKRKPVKQPVISAPAALDTIDNIQHIPVATPQNKLSVPVVAYMLSKNYSQSDIAKVFGQSRQSVSQYISRHIDRLDALRDYDKVFSWQLRDLNIRTVQSIDDHDIKKSPFGSRVLASATLTDKIRLLEDKSTSNIAVRDVASHYSSEINKLSKQRQEIMQQLGIPSDTDTSAHDS